MTFAREGMALVGLLVVGINTLLISLDVLSSYRRLGRLLRVFGAKDGDVRLWQGRLEGVELPALHLTQVGHSRGDGKMVIQERPRTSTLGEAVQLIFGPGEETAPRAAGTAKLDAPDDSVWVWPQETSLKEAFSRPELTAFADLELRARAARGVERSVSLTLSKDQPVYVLARLASDRKLVPAELALTSKETGEPTLLIAGSDPRRWLRSQRLRLGLSVLGIVIVFVLLTLVCFIPPAFGGVSQAGALGLLLFFLLVQPFGVYLGESSRLPHEALASTVWRRPDPGAGETLRLGSAR